jgi:transposase
VEKSTSTVLRGGNGGNAISLTRPWKRGVRYGTVLIELDTHDILDILADRETESVKKWLQSHPEIEVVSRDRGGVYADGAAQGAPQAIQCADRWHISVRGIGACLIPFGERRG